MLQNLHRCSNFSSQKRQNMLHCSTILQKSTSIVKASRNQLLIKINHQTCERIKNFRQRTFQHNQNALNAIMPHAKILAALQAGDADAAEHYMHSHLELVAQDLISMTRDGNVSL